MYACASILCNCIMVRQRNSLQKSMYTFAVISTLVEIFHEAGCLVIKSDSITKNNLDQSLNQNLHQYYYRSGPNLTNIETIEDDDPDYPYEQLLQLVEETKRILKSANVSEKMQLNLDPEVHDNYLQGDLSDSNFDFNISPQIPPFAGGDIIQSAEDYDSCSVNVQFRLPKRLKATDGKEYFIVNVGNKLRQKCNTVICKYRKSSCGSSYPPQGYTFSCEQSFNRIRKLVSIPVNDPISLKQQRLNSFELPDNCICKKIRISNN